MTNYQQEITAVFSLARPVYTSYDVKYVDIPIPSSMFLFFSYILSKYFKAVRNGNRDFSNEKRGHRVYAWEYIMEKVVVTCYNIKKYR